MYFTLGNVLGVWIWKVEDLGVWGMSVRKSTAKARARDAIVRHAGAQAAATLTGSERTASVHEI